LVGSAGAGSDQVLLQFIRKRKNIDTITKGEIIMK